MADILIRRCTLRIVRRSGWSWGAKPQELLAAAMRRLPELIASRLGELWPEELEREISAPLRLNIPLRLEEMLALETAAVGAARFEASGGAGLAQRIDKVVHELVMREAGRAKRLARAEQAVREIPSTPEPDPEGLWGGTVLAVLLGWLRAGKLRTYLLSFSAASLESWHASLMKLGRTATHAGVERAHEDLTALAEEIAAERLPLPAGRTASLIRRLIFLVEVAARYRLTAGDANVVALLDAHSPLIPADAANVSLGPPVVSDTTHSPALPAIPPKGDAAEPRASAPSAPAAPLARAQARAEFDVQVASALPFLLLGPLSRTGYLQALTATFEAAGLLAELPCFATALARKVLEPPEWGWYRQPAAVTAAAAFAGLGSSLPEPRIAEVARHLARQLSPLDAVVANALIEGHNKGRPLGLQRADLGDEPGFMLFEEEGIFPIAWAGRVGHLFTALAALDGELLLVPQAVASSEVLDSLDQAGFRFVTDAAPGRGEEWRPLTGGAMRAWSNAGSGSPGPLLQAAEKLQFCAQESEDLWLALATDRPSLPPACDPGVERTLVLAAALALGTIAWTLWRGREPVTPLLALQRFADLEARVRFRRDSVQVRLPLGRRFSDLREHGLLADIADVPWLGGRVLQFSGG